MGKNDLQWKIDSSWKQESTYCTNQPISISALHYCLTHHEEIIKVIISYCKDKDYYGVQRVLHALLGELMHNYYGKYKQKR